MMQELVGPLQAAFSLGLQYPPLAKEALAALERWEGQQPQALSAVAPRIVPLLNPYLLEITDHGTHTDETAAEGRARPCSSGPCLSKAGLRYVAFMPRQLLVAAGLSVV